MIRWIALISCGVVLLNGCGFFSGLDRVLPDRRTEYQKAESLGDLEVPPDLIVGGVSDRMSIPGDPTSAIAANETRPGPVAPGSQHQTEQRAELLRNENGNVYLSLKKQGDAAWDAVGQALQVAQIDIAEQERSRGIYYITYLTGDEQEQKRGLFSRLAFWKKSGRSGQYQLSLTGIGDKTEIAVLESNGEWSNSDAANGILRALYARLR